MLFRVFNSQEERRNFNGSAFIEVQFCKLLVGTKRKKTVSLNSIKNWQNDSANRDFRRGTKRNAQGKAHDYGQQMQMRLFYKGTGISRGRFMSTAVSRVVEQHLSACLCIAKRCNAWLWTDEDKNVWCGLPGWGQSLYSWRSCGRLRASGLSEQREPDFSLTCLLAADCPAEIHPKETRRISKQK